MRVKPGESALAFYTAENKSSAPITGVSTYNVTPMKVYILALPVPYQLSLEHILVDSQTRIGSSGRSLFQQDTMFLL